MIIVIVLCYGGICHNDTYQYCHYHYSIQQLLNHHHASFTTGLTTTFGLGSKNGTFVRVT